MYSLQPHPVDLSILAEAVPAALAGITRGDKLQASPWLQSALVTHVASEHRGPTKLRTDHLRIAFRDSLELLRSESPLQADLIAGRFWEGLTVPQMVIRGRPANWEDRTFFRQQAKALERFSAILMERETLCRIDAARQQTASRRQLQRNLIGGTMVAAAVGFALLGIQSWSATWPSMDIKTPPASNLMLAELGGRRPSEGAVATQTATVQPLPIVAHSELAITQAPPPTSDSRQVAPSTIELNSPSSGAQLKDMVNFSWTASSLPAGEQFDVRICAGADCQPRFGKTNTTDRSWSWCPDAGAQRYRWQVAVLTAAPDQTGQVASQVWEFTWTGGDCDNGRTVAGDDAAHGDGAETTAQSGGASGGGGAEGRSEDPPPPAPEERPGPPARLP